MEEQNSVTISDCLSIEQVVDVRVPTYPVGGKLSLKFRFYYFANS